jgi:mRNA interferase MazF
LIQFPFDDLSSSKVRPAYCLTNKIGVYQHIIFALITSRIPESPLHTDIILRPENPDFMMSGLRKSSTIRLDHLVTLRASLIQRELGLLSLETRTLIVAVLSFVMDKSDRRSLTYFFHQSLFPVFCFKIDTDSETSLTV